MTRTADMLDQAALAARGAARSADRATIEILRGDDQAAGMFTRQAKEHALSAERLLIAAGAARPSGTGLRDSVSLHLLDTPATRQLVAALEAATLAARAVDMERGWVDEEGRPCGIGETLGALYLEWRVEVEGPMLGD